MYHFEQSLINKKKKRAIMERCQRGCVSKAESLVKCKLNVWHPRSNFKMGHVSLSIRTEYISWWPIREWSHIGIEFNAKINNKLEDDIHEYGVRPDTFEIEVPLERVLEAEKWWKQMRYSLSKQKYNLFYKNCCTVVAQALQILDPHLIKDTHFVWMPILVQWAVEKSGNTPVTLERAKSSWWTRLKFNVKYGAVQTIGRAYHWFNNSLSFLNNSLAFVYLEGKSPVVNQSDYFISNKQWFIGNNLLCSLICLTELNKTNNFWPACREIKYFSTRRRRRRRGRRKRRRRRRRRRRKSR